jgi:hypothetical protein
LATYGPNNVILEPEDLAFFEDEPPPSPGLYKLACKGRNLGDFYSTLICPGTSQKRYGVSM